MTQVVGMVYRGFAYQGSDRRLSAGSAIHPVSDRANKSLVVSTGDSISLVGYTGLAEWPTRRFGLVQMDSFIAGACCRRPEWPWEPPTHENDLGKLQVGQLVQRIADWLTLLLRNTSGDLRPLVKDQMVQFVGFRRDRKEQANPYSFVVSWNATTERFGYRAERLFTAQSLEAQVTLTPTRNENSRARLTEYLNDFTADPESLFDGFGRSLIGFTHLVGVGGEFLILMLDPHEFTIYVDFISATGDYPVAVTPDGEVPVVPLPWHVGPGLVAPPVLTNMDSGGGQPDLRFLVPFHDDERTDFVKFEMERLKRVGPHRYELPAGVVTHDLELPAGHHTIEIRDRPNPSKHL